MDLTGNVFELTSSAYGASYGASDFPYPYDPNDGREDPDDPAEYRRVWRGGSWLSDHSYAPAALRCSSPPDYSTNHIGFRVVCRSVFPGSES